MGGHRIYVNGNHRAAAIRAAGFPVALVQSIRFENPWTLPRPWAATSKRPKDGMAYLRLLTRAGLLTRFCQHAELQKPAAHAGQHHQWLLLGDPAAARANLMACEQAFGPLGGHELDWIRDTDRLERLITVERSAMARSRLHATIYDLAGIARQPLPEPGTIRLAAARLEQFLDS